MYRIDPHVHTQDCSSCAHVYARELARAYAEDGFDGVIVTDHFCRDTYKYLGIELNGRTSRSDILRVFEGYERFAEEGEKLGLKVYRGLEVRFDDEGGNDFMMYGFSDDILMDPDAIFRMGYKEYSKIVRDSGALFIQAHPFRTGCHPVETSCIDGAEILNLNLNIESYNDKALAWVRENDMIGTAGSDCHRREGAGSAYITTEILPADSMEMARIIRERRFGTDRRDDIVFNIYYW